MIGKAAKPRAFKRHNNMLHIQSVLDKACVAGLRNLQQKTITSYFSAATAPQAAAAADDGMDVE